jgi:hypothetical protein
MMIAITERTAKIYRIALKADMRLDSFRWNDYRTRTPYQQSCVDRKIRLYESFRREVFPHTDMQADTVSG